MILKRLPRVLAGDFGLDYYQQEVAPLAVTPQRLQHARALDVSRSIHEALALACLNSHLLAVSSASAGDCRVFLPNRTVP